jgi:hypothetical protein
VNSAAKQGESCDQHFGGTHHGDPAGGVLGSAQVVTDEWPVTQSGNRVSRLMRSGLEYP